MKDHQAAQILYNSDVSGKEIARTIKVSEQTITSWKKKYGWENKKTLKSLARETAEETLWELINYQLATIKAKKEEWQRNKEKRLIDKGDIDALTKMFSAVKGKQLEWSNYVKICRELVDYIQQEDLDLAKQILEYVEIFLNNKRKEL